MVTCVDARCETVAGNMPGYENVAGKPCPVKPFFMGRARYESDVLSCVALHLACPVESYSTGVCNVALCEVVSQRGRRALPRETLFHGVRTLRKRRSCVAL